MKRNKFEFLNLLNGLVVVCMLASPILPPVSLVMAATDGITTKAGDSSPSEKGLTLPAPENPVAMAGDSLFSPVDTTRQQALGDMWLAEAVDIPGLVGIEPLSLNHDGFVELPSLTAGFNRVNLPQAPNPLALVSSISQDGLAKMPQPINSPATASDDNRTGETENNRINRDIPILPAWQLWGTTTASRDDSVGNLSTEALQNPSTWAFVPPDSTHTAPPRPQDPQQYQHYLPVVVMPLPAPQDDMVVTQQKGGVMRTTDDLLILTVPAGAVSNSTEIKYQTNSSDTPVQPDGTDSLYAFDLNATELATGNRVTQFDETLTLALLLPEDVDMTHVQQLTVAAWSEASGWEMLPTIPNPEKGTVLAYTDHLTHFELLATMAPAAEAVILAPHIPSQASTTVPDYMFYGFSTVYEFTGGPISLYPVEENGTHLWTDDAVKITVYRPDGSKHPYYKDYDLGGPGINPTLPIDVTDWFLPGTNGIEIELIDKLGPERGSSGYQIMPGAGCESQPPTIHSLDLSQTGQNANNSTGTDVIKVKATDNAGDVFVTVSLNGIWYEAIPYGNGNYILTLDYPLHQMNDYVVNVEDSCGNQARIPTVSAHGTDSDTFGWSSCDKVVQGCGNYQMPSGDPVNTANGNFYTREQDLVVSGAGNSDLIIERGYNAMAALWAGGTTMRYTDNGDGTVQEEQVAGPPQYFGTGWTFPYAVSLNIQSYPPYYDGIQVAYPDGHTANFMADDIGRYQPVSPANFDTLTPEGDGYVLRYKNSLDVERFDADGRLTSRADRNGNTITLIYSGDELSGVENDSGRWLAFAYTNGHITTITAPENRTLRYGYTGDMLTSFTDGNGHTTVYAYDDNKQLTMVTTPQGHTSLDQVYDDNFRVDWQKIGRAEINDFSYSDDGLTTTITDNYGRDTDYIYNDLGQIIKTVDVAGFSETYGYNENYNRTDYTDKEGRAWHWTYDDDGNRLTEDGPMGWQQEWDYNDLNRVTRQETRIDASQTRETRFDYDGKGNLIAIENAAGDSSRIVYDDRGLPTNIFDFNQNETVNTYDPTTGDLLKTENAEGDTIQYGYDGLGRMVAMTNGRFHTTTYAYDQADNLTDIDGPLGYHVGYRYDDNDNLRLEIDPNGGETEYWHDASDRVIRVENQLDAPTLFVYDDLNNLIHLEDAEGRDWYYQYDALYRQTAVHGPEDTHTFFGYDKVDNLTRITECNSTVAGDTCPDNRITTYAYNDLDQMVMAVENAVAGASETADTNVTTEFSYDLVGNLLSVTDALGNEGLYQYDLLDRLVREEDAEAQVTAYNYDDNGNLVWQKNPRDYITTFTYDGANRLETMTDADNKTWHYGYDANGNLTEETDPLTVVTHYEYDALDRVSEYVQNDVAGAGSSSDQNVTTDFTYDLAGNLRVVSDPRGTYETEHQYDAAHRRILTIDNEDGETEYGYDKVNNLVSVVDANQHETTFTYDGLNRQARITNPESHSVQFEYDRLGNTLSIIDARLNPTTFTYDGMNRVVLMVDALKGQWDYDYDAMGNLLCAEDANGHANDCYTYDDVYRVLSITDAAEYTDSFSYDKNGNRLTWTDGNEHITIYTYDVLDRLATVTNAEVETTAYGYDPLGNQTQLTEADGIVTRYGYDPLYRLAVVNQNDQPGQPESADVNVDTHYSYDEVGNLLMILDAEGHETGFAYDGLNRMGQETDADFNVWQYGYDAVGNRTWRIDANGNRTDTTYYPDNQPETISYALDGTTVVYAYDENNNQVEMVDPLGTTTWVYDALNRVTDVDDAFGRTLVYGYDAVGNRTSLTYPDGRVVQYAYYDNDWLAAVTDPESNLTRYERDGVGLVITTTNPNETVSWATYDKANRLLTLINQEVTGAQKTNSAFVYTYNDVGQRTEMMAEYGWRNPAVVTSSYTYDGLRRLIRDADSEGVWTDYTFDRVGNRLVLDTNDDSLSPKPFDEKTVYYSYSDANRLLSLVGNTHPGSPGTKQEENIGQTIYAFRHEVAAQRGKHIHELAADNLLTIADALIAELEGHPTPDEAEVAAAIDAIRVQVHSDRAGGLISSDGIANSLLVKLGMGDSANNGANDEWQTQTFNYDANGNRINTEYPGPQGPRVQGVDYTYDPENRLIVNLDYQENVQGNRVEGAITTMAHDGGGRRLAKTYDTNEGGGGAKRVEYVFDGWDPVAEYNQWNPQYENFYRGDMNRIISMQHFPSGTEGQMYWYHYDGLGSVAGLTKQHGQSHHNYRYEPYGQIELPNGNFTDPHNHYTFTGQEWDENMGLYEFYARDYDPMNGVWLTQDSYRGEQITTASLHRYQYVYNNPITYYDAYGHEVETDELSIEFFDTSWKDDGGCKDYKGLLHLCGQYSAGSGALNAGVEIDELDEVGLAGDLTSFDGTGAVIVGNKYLGIVFEGGGYGPKAEALAGYDEGDFGLNAGVKAVGGDARCMVNVANIFAIGIGGGAGLELEAGIKYSKKKGVTVNLGPVEGQLVLTSPRSQSYYDGTQKSLKERWNDL